MLEVCIYAATRQTFFYKKKFNLQIRESVVEKSTFLVCYTKSLSSKENFLGHFLR